MPSDVYNISSRRHAHQALTFISFMIIGQSKKSFYVASNNFFFFFLKRIYIFVLLCMNFLMLLVRNKNP